MQTMGQHVPNLIMGMTDDDDCAAHFLQWLEVLTRDENRYVTALAHNFCTPVGNCCS